MDLKAPLLASGASFFLREAKRINRVPKKPLPFRGGVGVGAVRNKGRLRLSLSFSTLRAGCVPPPLRPAIHKSNLAHLKLARH